MADNSVLNPGVGGDTVGLDDIAGVKYQRIKLIHGADGVNAGDVATGNPLPVVQTGTPALPTGAATSAKQDTGNTSLASIDGKITAVNTGAVVVSSSALPSGAATAARQDTGNTSVASLDTKTVADQSADFDTGGGTQTTKMVGIALPASGGPVAGGTSSNPLRTDPTGTTAQPVTDNGGSLTIDATSLPLPTGAATAAKQPALGTAGTASADVITVQGVASMTPLLTNGSGVTQPISAASLPLPTGAATSAKQDTQITAEQAIQVATEAAQATLGATTGAKVITDANGTLQQYLRGLVYLFITAGGALVTATLAAGTALIGYVGIKLTFAAKATITWTGTSLANGSARESTVIDNTSNKYRDVRIRVQTKGQASGTAYIDLYVYTALGDGTYTDAATGSDAAYTAANRRNSRYLGSILMNAASSAVQGEFQMSDIFATCPDKWGLIVVNSSGAALSATGGDHVLEYEGIY